jgi:hypothetical protein
MDLMYGSRVLKHLATIISATIPVLFVGNNLREASPLNTRSEGITLQHFKFHYAFLHFSLGVSSKRM